MPKLSIVHRALLAHIDEHPGCSKRAAAQATAFGQGQSTIRERMRTLSTLRERGLVVDREARRKVPGPYSRLYLTARGRRILEAAR